MTQIDTRATAKRLLGTFRRVASGSVIKTTLCAAVALLVCFLPEKLGYCAFEGLSDAGRTTLGILIFAALMWVTEAIPAFAVALLIIGLQVVILGRPGGVFTEEGDMQNWQMFLEPWSSPIMWLFIGGFVLAHSCAKTGLDKWLACLLIGTKEKKPAVLLRNIMGITFLFSMFMSNTATATMMIAVLTPLILGLGKNNHVGKIFILAIPIAANIGGMGTIIGTPPNAVAASQLGERINFMTWMYYALPPAVIITAAAYGILLWMMRDERSLMVKLPESSLERANPEQVGQRVFVLIVLFITITLWMTSALHQTPAAVVSLVPIIFFAVSGILTSKDMRELPWDVLILLAGGLSLGIAIGSTGLAAWFADQIPNTWSGITLVIAFCFVGVVLSNLMSNTATATIMIPVGIALIGPDNAISLAIPTALACSSSMCLPISTPPNAVAYASGRLKAGDFMGIGLALGIIGPVVAILWVQLIS